MRRAGLFVFIETAPAIRLCSIAGGEQLPPDGVDQAGGFYSGLSLTGLPALQQLINGVAERVDFTLSGVPRHAAYQAELESEDVRGAGVNVGLSAYDEAWQRSGAMLWLWHGEADVLTTDRATDEAGNVTRSISLSVGTANTSRKRARFETYTPLAQRRKSPTDAFCDLVPRYTQGSTKLWA